MLYLWDPLKAELNFRKHGVSFDMAQSVFDDPFHISILDSKHHNEERWVTIGRSVDQNTLIVIHMYMDMEQGEEVIRLISARKATKHERKQYEEGI